MITALAWLFVAVWLGMFVVDLMQTPRQWQCNCPMRVFLLIFPGNHLRTAALVATALALTIAWLLFAAAGHGLSGWLPGLVVTEWLTAWIHSKNSRKRLADKVLGVVRETAAGLKVEPLPGNAREARHV